jgi:hypothetical protein
MSEEIKFETLNIKLPEVVKKYTIEKQQEIFNYLSEMDEFQQVAYNIALNHLDSSFDIYRSNGFKEWKKSKITK